jgi:opacity protein-like surface antigen
MNIKSLAAGGLFAVCATLSSHALAEVITFDDINTANGYVQISNGYHGFDWNNFYVIPSNYYPSSGYDFGTVSAPNVAFNASANPASFSSVTAFSLNSVEVTKAWDAGITRFDGYVGNTLTYSMDVTSSTTAPTSAVFNWSGLNKVVMSDGNSTNHTAIDNLSVTAVPEPETYALMLAGLGLMGAMARRRNKKNTAA